MTRALTSLVLALTLAGVAPLAQADARKELAQKAVQLHTQAYENVAKMLVVQVMQPIVSGVGQALQRLPAERRDAVGKELQPEVKKFQDELDALLRDRAQKLAPAVLQPMFESKFTEEELRQLIAWLESPTSRKYAAVGAEMSAALQQKVVGETKAQVDPKIKALQDSLAAKLKAAAEKK
ncbi:DUF2059 domain-containing protein [Ideonella livida]|uniref:DUF2059 domain-containing protein n=1 Tax=Ideonella livida TaxID=2707176 RepID=A0A7C9PEV4_9BURK|nr:DUF2059 domain-containing protein [Ideonella livida]NDY90156.1 DUF2059 domain-containing protein [Ideonella livida]